MEDDYMKRGYLLPEGCKDLIDVLKLKAQQKPHIPLVLHGQDWGTYVLKPKVQQHPLPGPPTPLPQIVGEIAVAGPMSVRDLAAVLKQKPVRIIADLMELGIFATEQQHIPFEVIARVVRRYGYTARKTV